MIAKASGTDVTAAFAYRQGGGSPDEREVRLHEHLKALSRKILRVLFRYGECTRINFLEAAAELAEDRGFDLNDLPILMNELRLTNSNLQISSSSENVLTLIAKMGGLQQWRNDEGVSAWEFLAWLGNLPSSL